MLKMQKNDSFLNRKLEFLIHFLIIDTFLNYILITSKKNVNTSRKSEKRGRPHVYGRRHLRENYQNV